METGELTHEFVLQMLKTRMAFRQTIQRELKRNNIEMTFEMLQIMHRLWTEPGATQQCLAEKTAKDKACLTNLINNLEKKGWVTRTQDPADRRNRRVYLTPAGERFSEQVKPLLKGIYARADRMMNARQLEIGLAQMKKLNEILDQI